jgi:hypothetical protein
MNILARTADFRKRRNGVRANGLSEDLPLGLLSAMVGLLRSCVDYQEVIDFGSMELVQRESNIAVDSLFSALLR